MTLPPPVNTKYSAATTQAAKILVAKQVSGFFVGVDHPTSGQAKIVEEAGVKYLEFDSQFATDAGPDLKVILHNSATVNTKVQEGEYVTLGALRSTKASQRYQITADLDLSNFMGRWLFGVKNLTLPLAMLFLTKFPVTSIPQPRLI